MAYEIHDVETLQENRIVKKDMYWVCKDGDPKKAIFYNGTAQANKHKSIPDRLYKYISKQTGWNTSVVFIPVAYRPANRSN